MKPRWRKRLVTSLGGLGSRLRSSTHGYYNGVWYG